MNQAELEKIVVLAEQASAKVTDSTLKEQTYRIVLTELLRQGSSGSAGTVHADDRRQQAPAAKTTVKSDTPAAKIAAWVGIDEAALAEIFEFGESGVGVHLPHTVLPKKAADAQRLLAHIKLAADKIGYDTDEVASRDMIAMFDDHGCKDANVAKNLKTSEYIITKGGRGTMKGYKLRYTGMSEALSEIQDVLGGGL